MATKPGFIFSCSHYCSATFTLTPYSLHAKVHVNLYFNQCSIFTEYCFQLRNRFEWSKYLLVKLLPLNKSIPTPKFPTSPYLLTLFGKLCLTTSQIKTIVSLLPQCLWPPNLLKLMTSLVGAHSVSHARSLITRPCQIKLISILSQYFWPPNLTGS